MPDGLTLRQAAFAAEYLRHHGNGTKAAIAAGYAPSSAHVRASELVRHRKVRGHIAKLTKRHEITADRVLTRLDNLSAKAEEEGLLAVSVKAEELLGKALGLFIDRSVNVNVDMTGQHIDAIRALAARRSKKNGGAAGDDARVIEGAALEAPGDGDKPIFHNVGYASDDDKDVIDQRVSETRTLKQSRKLASDADGNNI